MGRFASAGDGNIAALLQLPVLLLSLHLENSPIVSATANTLSATANTSECIVHWRVPKFHRHLHDLPSATRCYTFAMPRDNLKALLSVTLIYPEKNEFYLLQKFDDKLPDGGLSVARRSDENILLAVKGHVDHRSAATRVGSSSSLQQLVPRIIPTIGETWNTVMAWTTGTLSVLFDECCADRSVALLAQDIPAWSVCQPMANGSSTNVSLYQGGHVIFAQDHRLPSWLILPDTFLCRNDTDYELIVSTSNASRAEMYLRTAPQNDSCRVLCIEERCDFSAYSAYYQTNLWSISNFTGRGSLRVQYKLRPLSAFCNRSAYSGFVLYSYGRDQDLYHQELITLTTYTRNRYVTSRELVKVPRSVHLVAMAVGSAASVYAILSLLIFVARRRRKSPPKQSTPRNDATQSEVAETSFPPADYCSLEHRSDAHSYAVLDKQEPQYTSLKPNTDNAIYSDLLVFESCSA